MVGALLTEILMDFTFEVPTLSPGYDSSMTCDLFCQSIISGAD